MQHRLYCRLILHNKAQTIGNQPGILFTLAVRTISRMQPTFGNSHVSCTSVHIGHMHMRPACLKAVRLAKRGDAHHRTTVGYLSMRPASALQATCTTMHNILCDPAEASIWEEAWETYKASGKAYGPGRKKPGCGPARPTEQSKAMPVSRVHAFCCIHHDMRHCSTVHVHGHSQMAMLLVFCSGSARECCLLLTAPCCTVCRKSGVQLLPLW